MAFIIWAEVYYFLNLFGLLCGATEGLFTCRFQLLTQKMIPETCLVLILCLFLPYYVMESFIVASQSYRMATSSSRDPLGPHWIEVLSLLSLEKEAYIRAIRHHDE
ncbi:hypothetical protein HAX54_000308 [Datura stramonium]|uniref:Uncharacterized protein n=1 Tax=Datura stramonium TaxID=4076 RepID=A0ABS8WPW1_DATST|nr:hypothetical protein [Datura stramonium]